MLLDWKIYLDVYMVVHWWCGEIHFRNYRTQCRQLSLQTHLSTCIYVVNSMLYSKCIFHESKSYSIFHCTSFIHTFENTQKAGPNIQLFGTSGFRLAWLFYETSQCTSRLQCFTTAPTTWKIYISLDWKTRHCATILKALWMQHVSAAPSERSWKHLEPGHGCNVQGDLLIVLGCQTNHEAEKSRWKWNTWILVDLYWS